MSTSTPSTAPAGPPPSGPAPTARPARGGMRGSWRSLLLSMLAVGGVVLVLFAVVPRPDSVRQPPVDVTPVARQIAEESHRPVWVPNLPAPWTSSVVRREAVGERAAFYAGYHRTDEDRTFVAVRQIPADTPAQAKQTWLTQAVSNGRKDGTVQAGGATWTRYVVDGGSGRRAFVTDLQGSTVVLAGLADDATLSRVASVLQPVRG